MQTAGLMMNDVWADRILRERGVEAYRFDNEPAEIGVLMESVELKHRGPDENYRPYLHMSGELRSVTPDQGLPYGISTVTYSPGQGERVDAYYEFDEEQLVALAAKGYFANTFVVPEQITNIEWELPAQVDTLVLAPQTGQEENAAAVIFAQVHQIGNLEIDLESCGYDLSEYFADHSGNGIDRSETIIDERGLRARSDAINSLFIEEEVALAEPTASSAGPAVEEKVDDLDSQLQQVEAQIQAEAEQLRLEQAQTEGTPEQLYAQRVARESSEAESSQSAANTELEDLELSEDKTPETSGPDLAERKRQVAERAADLEFGTDEGQSLGS